ncbi:MAG: ribonuclease P protein component [bacterium]
MLAKTNRIHETKEYNLVFSRSRKINSASFIFYCHYINLQQKLISVSPPQFGFVASKKVAKACKRNLLKRRLRAIAQIELPLLKPDFQAVVVIKNTALNVTYPQLQEEFKKTCQQLNLYAK